MRRRLLCCFVLVASFAGSAGATEPPPPRASRIVARLVSQPEGAMLAARAGGRASVEALVRLGSGPSRLEGPRTLHLDAARSDDALAARLGHLLRHVIEPLPAIPSEPSEASCSAWVARVVTLETPAHATEDRLVVALRVGAAREPLESVDALAEAYRERCLSGRR